VQWRLLVADCTYRFEQVYQIAQARHAARMGEDRADRNHQPRRRFIESGFTATGIACAERLDDSFIQIAQASGHVQKDQFGAALSKTSVRILSFLHVVHSPSARFHILILCVDSV